MAEEESQGNANEIDYQQGQGWAIVSTENDVIAAAIQKCEKFVIRPYTIALKGLGWLSLYDRHSGAACVVVQSVVIVIFLLMIGTTFVTQGILCFQRDLLLLTLEQCVNNKSLDANLICCKNHFISAFVVPDFLLISSYLFGIYLFSRAETEYLSNLAAKVFIKSISANGGKPPMKLVYTIVIYSLAGLVWIIVSVVMRIIYLLAFSLWQDSISIFWSDASRISGDVKRILIVAAIAGFVIFDIVYIASLMNYAIQSEMNIYLLKAIAKLAREKKYNNFDEAIKDINEADTYVQVLNGRTAAGTSLVVFNLSISAVVSLQQLNELQTPSDTGQKSFSTPQSIAVAFLNAVLWITFVAFALVQASRVTNACQQLQKCGPFIRARPFQYAASPQVDLDSFVLFSHASKLRARLFGIPIFPWMVYLAAVMLPFVIIVLVKTNVYKLFTHF